MAKHPITPKRRRHVVAGQRRLAREQVTDVAAPPARELVTAPSSPPSPPSPPPSAPAPAVPTAPPQLETRPVSRPLAPPPPQAPMEKPHRRLLQRLPRPRLSVPAGWARFASPIVVVAVLAALVVGLATLGGFLFTSWQHDRDVASAKKQSVVAARDAMTAVLSYNYQTIDKDIAHAESYLTGTFRTEYRETALKTVKDAALRYKATVKADVVYAGAIGATPNTAKVLVFVDQTANNTQLKAPRLDRNRVRLELRQVHGKWLVSKLEAV